MSTKSTNKTDFKIGAKMKRERLVNGLTREVVGGKLGVTLQQLQKYETGTNRISASRLFDYCKIVNKPIEFFFDDKVAKPIKNERVTVGLIDDVNKLSLENKTLIRAVVKAMVS